MSVTWSRGRVDISSGDMSGGARRLCRRCATVLRRRLVDGGQSRELEKAASYLLKHTTQTVTARVRNIHYTCRKSRRWREQTKPNSD